MSFQLRFQLGDKVRVKAGVRDPDNPDLPIGRWRGQVEEIEADDDDPAVFLVSWDDATRAGMPPVFVQRCQLEGLEIDQMWLDEADLENDDGANLPMELPEAKPLDLRDRDDRLREIFGLPSGAALPEVDEVSLRIFHAHMLKKLPFPFDAHWVIHEASPPKGEKVAVLGLSPPEEADMEDGLLCKVKSPEREGVVPLGLILAEEGSPYDQLLEDYAEWLRDDGGVPNFLPFQAPGEAQRLGEMFGQAGRLPAPRISMGQILNFAGLIGAVCGAAMGAILATIPAAPMGMLIGSGVGAGLVGLLGRKWGQVVASINRSPRAVVWGMVLGVLCGAVLGVLFGALAVAFVGSVSGSIVGSILGGLLAPQGREARAKMLGFSLGACLGAVILAVTLDREEALRGVFIGTIAGAAGMVLLVLAASATLGVLFSRRR